jgi:hypothetical protein
MIRHAFLSAAFLLLLSSPTSPVYGWGSATHAYIAHEIGSQQGASDLKEIYGALLPDAFNVMFGDPYQSHLWTQTHYDFMKLVNSAASDVDRAVAYGFAGHNEAWGADRTAHISAIGAPEEGYVIRKQNELAAIIEPQIRLFLLFSGVSDASEIVDEVLPVVAHTAIETAIDLLVCENEAPDIGHRLVLAARTRGWSAPILLCKAYAADLAATAGTTESVAAPLIIAAESEFRHQMELYGTALTQEDPIASLAEQGAEVARMLLAAEQGIVAAIPPDLMRQILDSATNLVKDDYATELAATVSHVRNELEARDIREAGL